VATALTAELKSTDWLVGEPISINSVTSEEISNINPHSSEIPTEGLWTINYHCIVTHVTLDEMDASEACDVVYLLRSRTAPRHEVCT